MKSDSVPLSVRVARRIPLPTGDEPEAWLLDTNPWTKVTKVYFDRPFPFRYSPFGRRVRMLMPAQGLMRIDKLIAELTAYCSTIPDDGASIGLDPDWTPYEKATVMYGEALSDPSTSFMAYTVWPNGRVVAFSGAFGPPHYQRRSWHPDVPWGGRK